MPSQPALCCPSQCVVSLYVCHPLLTWDLTNMPYNLDQAGAGTFVEDLPNAIKQAVPMDTLGSIDSHGHIFQRIQHDFIGKPTPIPTAAVIKTVQAYSQGRCTRHTGHTLFVSVHISACLRPKLRGKEEFPHPPPASPMRLPLA